MNSVLKTMTEQAGSLDVDDLRELMGAVAETTERLQQTHTALKEQVAQLQKELAEANAKLRRSRSLAALGEMAAGIAHEIRNPLGSIQLYVQMLQEDLHDRPEQAELCRKVDRAVVGLDAIVRDVLSFARKTTIHPRAIEPNDLVQQALDGCVALFRSGAVELACTFNARGPLRADSDLVSQALANVVRNAAEALAEMGEGSEPSRRVHVLTEERKMRCPGGQFDERVVLAVEDNGPGIPPEVVERMFNPFFTTRQTGTGLGLAIVHRIVDAHGGHINVSNLESGGARIEICLPRQPIDVPRESGDADDEQATGESGPSGSVPSAVVVSTVSARHDRSLPPRTNPTMEYVP